MKTDANIPDADGFYEAWLDALQGLDRDQAAVVSARLVFLLANQVGDQKVLLECVAAAREGVATRSPRSID